MFLGAKCQNIAPCHILAETLTLFNENCFQQTIVYESDDLMQLTHSSYDVVVR